MEGMAEVQPDRQRLELLASQVMNLMMKGEIPVKLLQNGRTMSWKGVENLHCTGDV